MNVKGHDCYNDIVARQNTKKKSIKHFFLYRPLITRRFLRHKSHILNSYKTHVYKIISQLEYTSKRYFQPKYEYIIFNILKEIHIGEKNI